MTAPTAGRELSALLASFPSGRASLLPALHRVQEHYGYIPPWAIPILGEKLRIAAAEIYGVISFYSELRLEPPPQVLVSWCSGPACRLKGSENLRRAMEATLGIKMEETAADGRVGLHLAQCNGTCDLAPMIWINGQPRGPLTAAEVVRLARRLKAGSAGDE